jgi:hypothetical protein
LLDAGAVLAEFSEEKWVIVEFITHKGKSYPGEHPAIIDQPLWVGVQTVLAQNRVERATGARTKYPSLLGG